MRGPGLAALALALLPGAAAALEPTTVQAEGVVTLSPAVEAASRDLAFRAALEEAVFEVASLFVSPLALELDEARIRAELAPHAPGFVLTYRVHGAPLRRPSPEDPEVEELVLSLTATVDAAQVRERLREAGLLRAEGERPSLALRVTEVGEGGRVALLGAFEDGLRRRLERAGYIVVESELSPGATGARSALDLARSLGVDLGVEIGFEWRSRAVQTSVASGVAVLRFRAVRARDAVALAEARFEAPGHHADPDEAVLRALEALQGQIGDNLVLQLDRSWRALARDGGSLTVELRDVTSLLQIEAIQRTLRNVLGAEESALIELGPGRAALAVRGPLSPGALQDRLAAVAFEGFRLEPLQVRRRGVDLRVAPAPEPAPQIDTPERN